MTAIRIEFVMDDEYYREFHREWVAALGPGWRASRRLAAAFALIAVGLGTLGVVLEGRTFAFSTATAAVAAVVISVGLARRKASWLRAVRALPWFGKTMCIEVRDGVLVQTEGFEGDPEFRRDVPVVLSPNGYFVKLPGRGDASDEAVSTTEASVYLPHRAITPPMTSEEFLNSLSTASPQGED